MNKRKYKQNISGIVIGLMTFVGLLCSCGEDRTYEYEEKTEGCHAMQTLLQEWYLWNDSIKDLGWKDYFSTPSTFITKLSALSPDGDSWSYCVLDTLETDPLPCGYFNHVKSYGMDMELITDPTGETTKQYARIITVYPNSPASECGLERNDFIAQVGTSKVTKTVLEQLVSGNSRSLIVNKLGTNYEDSTFYWISTDTVQIAKSRKVNVDAVMVSKMLTSDFAYLMLTNMNSSSEILTSLKSLIGQNPSDLIIDLRLCNQGSIDCVLEIAKLITNTSSDFLKTFWNEDKSSNNTVYTINGTSGLNVFFITSNYTQGAPEWLIYGLKAMEPENVVVVGQTTAGQNVMLKEFKTEYYYTVYPAVAFVADKDGNYDYSDGIEPDLEINEFNYSQLYPYGDKREIILDTILSNY